MVSVVLSLYIPAASSHKRVLKVCWRAVAFLDHSDANVSAEEGRDGI